MSRAHLSALSLLALAGMASAQIQFQITTTSPLPTGQVGEPYSIQLQTNATAGTVFWTLATSSLPPGFVFDTSRQATAGTLCTGTQNDDESVNCTGVAPASAQGSNWTLTVQATDGQLDQSATKTFSLTVVGATPPSITSSTLQNAVVGQPYSFQFQASGGTAPLTWSEFSAQAFFPPSFSLSSTGVLSSAQVTQADYAGRSGSPYTFAIQVRDANGLNSQPKQFNLTVTQGLTITTASPLPNGIVNSSYQSGSGLQLQATGGTGSYNWSISSGSLPTGLTLASGGLISGIPTTAISQDTFTVQVTDVGVSGTSPPTATKAFILSIVNSTLSIVQTTLPVAFQNQPYTTTSGGAVTLTAQGGQPPYTWSLGSTSVSALSIAAATGVITGTPSNTPGTYSVPVTVQDSASTTAQFTFQLQIAANLTISTTTLPNGTTGQAYSATVNEAGGQGPYTWAISAGSLPPGLTLQSSTGNAVTISGTPTGNGVYQITVKVTDTGGRTATAALQIQIGPTVSITTTTLPDGSLGNTYTQSVVATGGQTPYSWTLPTGSLPGGLTATVSADTTMYIISGTPTAPGQSQFTVQVTDAQSNTAQQALTINIGVPLIITSVSVPNGSVGVAYSAPLGANGGTPAYTWSIINGTLPGGLSINANNGLLSGSPTTSGNYSFTVQVKDASGATAQRAFSMSVVAQLSLTAGNFSGQVGTALAQTLSAGGGVPPYTYAIQSGSLPTGVTFNGANGSFSGTPTTSGNTSVVVVVTDSAGGTANATVSFAIALNNPPPLSIANISPSPNQQPALNLTLGGPFSAALTGTITLTFASSVGGDDQTVTFTDGTRTATFSIPAGNTAAIFSSNNFGIRTGTVAGTITLRVTSLLSGNTAVTLNPAPQIQIVIPSSAPVLTAVTCAAASGGFTVSVTGYSTTRNMTTGTFTFTAPSGSTIQSASTTTLVQLSAPFATWFASATSNATGGQFLLTMPFTISQGSATGIGVSVALGNSVSGSNSLSATCQ